MLIDYNDYGMVNIVDHTIAIIFTLKSLEIKLCVHTMHQTPII